MIKHSSATVQGFFNRRAGAIYFSNPHCEEYGFLDAFPVVPDSCQIHSQSKRDFLGLFNPVEQLCSFMMDEFFNDWGRADEIPWSDSPFDGARLCKTIRVHAINVMTGEVSIARHAFDTDDW